MNHRVHTTWCSKERPHILKSCDKFLMEIHGITQGWDHPPSDTANTPRLNPASEG